jgi:hypothetical protein
MAMTADAAEPKIKTPAKITHEASIVANEIRIHVGHVPTCLRSNDLTIDGRDTISILPGSQTTEGVR